MFDDDADDSRARAEQGRKNQRYRELYESVKLDIKNEADAGNNSTTYRLPKDSKEFVDPLVERLTEESYTVTVSDPESDRPRLDIAWDPNDIEE
ncbi:hypothetical protein WL01_14060 [Burkholderia ubonensis]|uniref:hypothetical protein n=1 Tax=Burkholderia ubonensis TaxID=101571 RepID=UPI000759F973|nr:hypothetical protein [Burkholderia ubonensis]KVX18231.1 hypothetical protein WL01_14060 [Burkholderia ubonensis]KWB21195.1 hypothetical protein WL33_03330 [Burkholderia ubonensis]